MRGCSTDLDIAISPVKDVPCYPKVETLEKRYARSLTILYKKVDCATSSISAKDIERDTSPRCGKFKLVKTEKKIAPCALQIFRAWKVGEKH